MRRTSNITASTWLVMLDSIKSIQRYRDSLKKGESGNDRTIRSLNSTLILNSAAVVEGSVSSLLISHILYGEEYKSLNQKNGSMLRNILDDVMRQIYSAQWGDLARHSEVICGINLSKVDPSNWEAITCLFTFRNILAHGSTILVGTDFVSSEEDPSKIDFASEERIEKHNRKGLFDYLKKQKFLDSNEVSYMINWQFLKNEIADFFVDKGSKYRKCVYESYIERHPWNNHIKTQMDFISEDWS